MTAGRLGRSALIVVAAVLLVAHGAPAQTGLTATIAKKATLADGSQAVDVTVRVACPAGSEVLEAFVYVTQDDNSSQFGGIPVVCDGTLRTYVVRVPALDFLFEKGRARASGYVLLESESESVSPTQAILIKKK